MRIKIRFGYPFHIDFPIWEARQNFHFQIQYLSCVCIKTHPKQFYAIYLGKELVNRCIYCILKISAVAITRTILYIRAHCVTSTYSICNKFALISWSQIGNSHFIYIYIYTSNIIDMLTISNVLWNITHMSSVL